MPAAKAKSKGKTASKSKASPKAKAKVSKAKAKVSKAKTSPKGKSKAKTSKAKTSPKSKGSKTNDVSTVPKGKAKAKSITPKEMANKSSIYYIPLSLNYATTAAGVYGSKDEALDGYIEYILKNQTDDFENLKDVIKEDFDTVLTKEKFRYILSKEWKTVLKGQTQKKVREVHDAIFDSMQFEIAEYKKEKGDIFDFTPYGEWDVHNLYKLLVALQGGKIGKL